MEKHLAALSDRLGIHHPRRTALGGGLAALFALGQAAPDDVEARKRKRKKKRKKKPKPPTCAESCPAGCTICFNRPDGPPICSGGLGAVICSIPPCATDSDCIDTDSPYCITNYTNRADGMTFPWGCSVDDTAPRCTQISGACV